MRIDPEKFYQTTAPELSIVGAVQTLARWRHEGRGPAFIKAGSRVLYRGSDVIEWLDARRVATGDVA